MYTNDTVLVRRSSALKALIVTTVPLAVLFGGHNIFLGMYFLALLNMLLLVICIGLLLVLRRGKLSTPLVLTYLAAVFGNLAWVSALPGVYPTGHAWLPVFPVLSYLLLEPRLGFRRFRLSQPRLHT